MAIEMFCLLWSGGVAPNDAAAGASTFVVSGGSERDVDFDPRPAVDTISGGVTFLSCFAD